MPTTNERAAIKLFYGVNSQFASKVDKMPDRQVLAIYFRLKKEGKIK